MTETHDAYAVELTREDGGKYLMWSDRGQITLYRVPAWAKVDAKEIGGEVVKVRVTVEVLEGEK